MRKLTHDEQVAAIRKMNPDVTVLGEIEGNGVKTLCRCNICDWEWEVTPAVLKSGHGCPRCSGKIKLHGEYEEEVKKIHPTITPLKPFVKCRDKVPCRCEVCGNIWNTCPESLKSGYGCPVCNDTKRTQEEWVEIIAKISPTVIIREQIKNNYTPVLCECSVCHHTWKASLSNLQKGTGCSECAKYGFRQKSKESSLYLLVDDLEIPTMIKVGVTVDFKSRFGNLKRHTPFPIHVLKVFTFEAGCATLQLEQLAHTVFADRNCHFEGFDGCTEWFWYSHEILEFIENNC